MKDYELYRSVYCGLCKSLGKRYTHLSRMTLNYDFTAFAVLRIALQEEQPCICREGCLFNPLARRSCLKENDELDFAADALILSTYHKLRDDLHDDGFWKRFGKRPLYLPYKGFARKAAKRSPEAARIMSVYIDRQEELERQRCAHLDAITEPTSAMLSELLTYGFHDEKIIRILACLGENLGKWVYLIDALDDIPKDLQSQSYNPIVLAYRLDEEDADLQKAVRDIEVILNSSIREMVNAIELLPMKRFEMIVRNIFYMGLPMVQNKIIERFV